MFRVFFNPCPCFMSKRITLCTKLLDTIELYRQSSSSFVAAVTLQEWGSMIEHVDDARVVWRAQRGHGEARLCVYTVDDSWLVVLVCESPCDDPYYAFMEIWSPDDNHRMWIDS